AALVGAASGALVGKDGRVYACYKAKGKRKGAVRLVTKKGKCHKGEKKVSWSAAGPAGQSGENGQNGENGAGGEGGAGGEKGTTGTQGLEKQVQSLTSKVTSLESVLKGINPGDLTGMLSKLQGISPTQLQEAVASVTKVNALCDQTKTLTSQSNALGSALGGLKLINVLPPLTIGLEKAVPIPNPLSAFACP
ncbi:MAG TPA: hypothetical protein VH299_10725, partial [Solirubrobacterales bacterium]|nr:hypothetical protein [Solirubrobacterales bacterium]